mgnify:CR=1 FL=1
MYYQTNRETGKLELIFDKAEYQALSDEQKREIKSNFLFARSIGGWVSRCKFPNLYRAEHVAQNIGAENRGKTGETLSFAEQQERKAERAEARADRMENRSDRAAAEGERLQKPINDMHGDIAFFTQPNISSSAGRAFTNRRNRMWSAWERGWDEFKKSEYYAERAETARRTATEAKAPSDKGFCERRLKEAEKSIRTQKEWIELYNDALAAFENGESYEVRKWYTTWTPDDRAKIEQRLERAEEIMEAEISKAIYWREAIEALGGIQFSRDNLNSGDLLKISRWREPVRYLRGGPKNFTYEFTLPHMTLADGRPMQGQASYAEIERKLEGAETA